MRAEDNDLLTRIGPGTDCGALLRRYWQPAALLDEFDPQLDPRMAQRPVKAVRLLGQDLVLFRDGQGRFGLLDRDCPHRGADLSFGRHEPEGLRCPFHGWKFAVDGRCLETPAEPMGSTLCTRVRQRSYPVRVQAGVVFAWLGPEGGTPPELPAFDAFTAPASHSFAFKGLWQCNWLQAFEVGIDPAHPSFLHRYLADEEAGDERKAYGRQFRAASVGSVAGERWPMTRVMREVCSPEIRFDEVAPGLTRLTTLRAINEALTHVRVTHAVFPHTFVIPLSETVTITQMHVPVDDTHTYWYSFFTSFAGALDKATMRAQRLAHMTLPDYVPRHGRHDNWNFNPEEQRTRTYLGMGEEDINLHDQWAVESMGAIQDRTREHLGTSDKVIMAHRRALLQAMATVRAGGTPPMVPDAAAAAALQGPDTVDCIAPAADWAAFWQQAAAAKRAWRRLAAAGGRNGMTVFAERCGVFDAAAAERVQRAVREWGLDEVRVAWCDVHGLLRGKTLMPGALGAAFEDGVGMVGTLMLKDSSDRTAVNLFEPGALAAAPGLAGFGRAGNLLLLPDAASFRVLPWAPGTGWLQAQPWFDDATPVPIDPRRALQAALAALAAAGFGLRCGLEVEFHIYRITEDGLDPALAEWPAEPPAVTLIHPGYQLLGEAHADQAAAPLAIVRRTAQALGLPLRSLEIELGPSQVEAVFDATDALTAADQMVLFRNGVRQALRRAGYLASFVCRPPFANVMASGWHLHQSLVALTDGRNAFVRDAPAGPRSEAQHWLTDTGSAWLAGLLAHARGAALCCTSTVNGYGRFQPNVMAPVAASWGRDHRGAMLRVLGGAGDAATRIENRLGEPMANPYLYIASQVHAGLDGLRRGLVPPPATDAPYVQPPAEQERLPAGLGEAIAAFKADTVMVQGFGAPLAWAYGAIKASELARFERAEDGAAWQRREYFGRY